MHKKKLSAFLLGSTAWLLVACQSPATETTTTEAATSTSQVQSETQTTTEASHQAASRASSLEAAESVQAQSASSTTTDSAATIDEATLITEAKQTITQLTGYVESDVYLFIVESVQGNEVTINVRENGADVASSVGFYRYDGMTGELLEMDVVTGEYTRHPAQY